MKLQLTTNESALEEVVKSSGLQVNEGAEIKGAYLPFLEQFSAILEQSEKINSESPTKEDEKLASELRKKAVKIRTGAEALKDDRKKIYLIKGNLEQASFNVIKNSCLLAEESFRSVEEFSARQEAARKKKAAKAPDKKKLELMLQEFSMLVIELNSEESKSVYREIGVKLEGFKTWAKNQIETL